MKSEVAKPIAQGLGVVLMCIFALVAWYFDFQIVSWPRWVIVGLLVGTAGLIVYASVQITKRFR
jgi:hypothetical protein